MRRLPARALLCVCVLFGAFALADENNPVLLGLTSDQTSSATRVVLESSGPLVYTYYTPDPLTLVVDIPDADGAKLPPLYSVSSPEVVNVTSSTVSRPDGHSLSRLEVKLAKAVQYQIFSEGKTLNLVFDRGAAAAAADKPTNLELEPKLIETPPAKQPTVLPEQTVAAARRSPTPAATPEPAPKAPVAGTATRIVGVTHRMTNGSVEVTVKADGTLGYEDFFVPDPPARLVIDIVNVAVAQRSVPINQNSVRRVRLAQYSPDPKVGRLVFDLAAHTPYEITDLADGMRIVFTEPRTAHASTVTPVFQPAVLSTETPVEQAKVSLKTSADPEPVVSNRAQEPAPQVMPTPAPAPVVLSRPVVTSQPATVIVPASVRAQTTPVTPPVISTTLPGYANSPGGMVSMRKVYTGHPISLDFREGDLQDILRLFADISGLNIIVNPGVAGKVTVKLNEVPWDQALDIILKSQGLGQVTEDNVIRVAPLSALQREEDEIRKLKENQALAGDLIPYRKSLSYAKVADIEDTIKKVALSPRGTITLDTRTNTIIITDLQKNVTDVQALILDLDRQTPQVEIEARIVVTSRNFTRDVGVQWGFLNKQTPQYGNTTGRAFPNSIILNGAASAPSQGINPQLAFNPDSQGIGPTPRGYAVNLPAASFTSGIGISLGNILGSFNIDAALTALERQGRGRILSTPKVTTQNNQEAEIKQGVQIPIAIQQASGGASFAATNVQFKDAFLILKVTPQITDAGTVILKLEVENNSPDFANRVNGIPPINTQSAKTIVLVRDGATTVIGGIYQSSEQSTLNSTPFFGKLPILGALFRNRASENRNNELLLFITPRIIKG